MAVFISHEVINSMKTQHMYIIIICEYGYLFLLCAFSSHPTFFSSLLLVLHSLMTFCCVSDNFSLLVCLLLRLKRMPLAC